MGLLRSVPSLMVPINKRLRDFPIIERTGVEDFPFVEDREELISYEDQTERARRALVRVGKHRI